MDRLNKCTPLQRTNVRAGSETAKVGPAALQRALSRACSYNILKQKKETVHSGST